MVGETDGKSPHHFRAKLMDAEGRIENTVEITAANEAEALDQIKGLTMSYAIELWDGGRLLRRLSMRRG